MNDRVNVRVNDRVVGEHERRRHFYACRDAFLEAAGEALIGIRSGLEGANAYDCDFVPAFCAAYPALEMLRKAARLIPGHGDGFMDGKLRKAAALVKLQSAGSLGTARRGAVSQSRSSSTSGDDSVSSAEMRRCSALVEDDIDAADYDRWGNYIPDRDWSEAESVDSVRSLG